MRKVWWLVVLAVCAAATGCGDDSEAPLGPGVQESTATDTSTTVERAADELVIANTVDLGLEATGRWRVEEVDGVWWFVTPDGRAMFSMGSNKVDDSGTGETSGEQPYLDAILAKYGTVEAWADAAVAQLSDLGFNTAGAWSTYELMSGRVPYTPVLSFSHEAPEIDAPALDDTSLAEFARPLRDYFDPAFADGASTRAADARSCAEDPWCIGVFTDNEMNWGPSATQTTTYLDAYLRLAAGAPGKVAVQEFFTSRYGGDLAAFDAVWPLGLGAWDEIQDLTTFRSDLTPGTTGGDVTIEELTTGDPDDILALVVVQNSVIDRETPEQTADRRAFRDHVAEQYYATVDAALAAVDPDLLNLGTRPISIFTDTALLDVVARHVDVVSLNDYEFTAGVHALVAANWSKEDYLFADGPHADLDAVYEATDLPILITEWSYRARVPDGPPSDFPPSYPIYDTQAQRADGYTAYMDAVLDHSAVIGAHWFLYSDQPASGRGDGENNNFGIVDMNDDLWTELGDAMASVNAGINERRLDLAG